MHLRIPAHAGREREYRRESRRLAAGGNERREPARRLPGEDDARSVHVGQPPHECVHGHDVVRSGRHAAQVIRRFARAYVFAERSAGGAEAAAQRQEDGVAALGKLERRRVHQIRRLLASLGRRSPCSVIEYHGAHAPGDLRPQDVRGDGVALRGPENPYVLLDERKAARSYGSSFASAVELQEDRADGKDDEPREKSEHAVEHGPPLNARLLRSAYKGVRFLFGPQSGAASRTLSIVHGARQRPPGIFSAARAPEEYATYRQRAARDRAAAA